MNKELENSEQFINQMVGKETGFSVSKNYFDEIEDNFSARLFEENNIKKATFEIPENYFNNLEDSILQKIILDKDSIKIFFLRQKVLKMIPLTAAAAILLFIGLTTFNFDKTTPLTFDSISDNEIENWLEKNSDSINSEDIITIFSEDNFLESDFAFTDIEDENIERYIYSNDDLTIINELY
jgi:hypothetical protein